MKASAYFFLVLCLTGCATSKYASNPGAAVVGPGYLDAIAANPRTRATEYYYPGFKIQDFQLSTDAAAPLPKGAAGPEVMAFLTYVPEPSADVKAITGKGYPCLERRGIYLFTEPAQK